MVYKVKKQKKKEKPFYQLPKRIMTEREVLLLKRRLNDRKIKADDIAFNDGFKLTPEQTQKGYKWLMNQWKSPKTGIVRKTNPFGYREENVLEKFKEFKLIDFIDNVTPFQREIGIKNYQPVYRVIAKDGSSFQYYNKAGIPKIIG